jgi:hypothetical protein
VQAEGIAHGSYLPTSRPNGFIPNCQSLNEHNGVSED